MMTSRWALSALVFGLFVLDGCTSSGQYRIPTVAPVVKQNKSEDDDLMKELEGDDSTPAPKASSTAKATSKEETAPKSEPAKAEAAKPDATKAEPAKTEAAKPEAGKADAAKKSPTKK